jgi:hypothetical protein
MSSTQLLIVLALVAAFIISLMGLTLAPLFRRSTTAKLQASLLDLVEHMPPEPDQDVEDEPAGASATAASLRRRGFRKYTRAYPFAPPRRGPAQAVAVALRLPIRFHYTMPNGSRHLRYALVVTALGYTESSGQIDVTLLRCVCGATKQWRTFSVARMDDLIDLKTGEVVRAPNAWIMEQIYPWQRKRQARRR